MTTTKQIPQWCEDQLAKLDMVDWDRFTVGQDPKHGLTISVYGWIDREDEFKDFVIVVFYPESGDDGLQFYTTSSDEWTAEIHERLFGVEPESHNDCKRVENYMDIPNAIELDDQPAVAGTTEGDR